MSATDKGTLLPEFTCTVNGKPRRCSKCSGCRGFLDFCAAEFGRGTPVNRIAELSGAHYSTVRNVKERFDRTGVICFKQGGTVPAALANREKVDPLFGAKLKCTRCHLRFHLAKDCETSLEPKTIGCALGASI